MATSSGNGAANVRAGDNVVQGVALTIGAVLIFGVQDAVAKMLVQDYSPFQMVMIRFWAFAVFSLVLVARQAPLRRALSSAAPGWQIARAVLLVADIWLFALAVRSVPLAPLQAISLVYPLLVTLLAIPILGERVGLFRITAVAVGFAGVLIVIRPGGVPLSWDVAFGALSALSYAIYVLITRKVAGADSTATSMAYVGLVGLVLTTGVGMFYWQPIALDSLPLVAIIMLTTCTAHGMIMAALKKAPASILQPFNFISLPWSLVLSLIFFSAGIDPISLVGALVIVGAGLVVTLRERVRQVSSKMVEPPSPGRE